MEMTMSKREKRWRRFYLILLIFIYAVFVPVSVLEWLIGDERFPLTAIVVSFGLPMLRKNHIKSIREKENHFTQS
ncbi:hypothetical protein [Bacillus sp. FJAT-49736]|uniref:hypothetical protein n=1 Tax=Bacillus sp. FJAT-49736 TaxID=2833582 RepID=UPI001BC8F171|nr:hypothetical protein [Bacillus sp. FJAT-49736]MBS4175856.1 hypothetical protein [Bacillus sp. FJAT-49736]